MKSILSTQLGEETIVLNLENGHYYGLCPVGARMWELLHANAPVAKVVLAMVEEFEVEPSVCERDVRAFKTELERRGLLCSP